jgi:hypothetical protein
MFQALAGGKMKNRNGKKDGRKSAGRHKRLVRTKADCSPSVLLSVNGKSDKLTKDEIIHGLQWGLKNSRDEIVKMIDLMAILHRAVLDALFFYDRVAGTGHGEGWTATDVRRLEEIRKLVGN